MATPRPTEARLLRQVVRDFEALLPNGWTLTTLAEPAGRGRPDLVAVVRGPDGTEASLIVEAKRTFMPRDAGNAVMQLRSYAEQAGLTDASLVVVAPFLSETAREQITGLDANYIDSTGNILVRTQRPALFIKQDGAKKDPWPSDETLRTLKGRGAGRALRALLDFQPPYGVRELAGRAKVPLGSLSRTVDLLDRDGLITKDGRGPITDLDWEGVIRRWAKDYDVTTSNQVSTFLEPRGLAALSSKLGKLKTRIRVDGRVRRPALLPCRAGSSRRDLRQRCHRLVGATRRSPRRQRCERLAPRAVRRRGLRSRCKQRRCCLRESDPTGGRPPHRPRPRPVGRRGAPRMDERTRACLANPMSSTSARGPRCSTLPRRWRLTSTRSSWSAPRPSTSTRARPTWSSPSSPSTPTSALNQRC